MTDLTEYPAPMSTGSFVMIAYKYGCPRSADFDEVAMEQLKMAHDLANKLVETHKAHEARVDGIWASHPEVKLAQDASDEAEQQVEAIVAKMLKERSARRTTHPKTESKAELSKARSVRAEARKKLKECKTTAMAVMRPQFAEAKYNKVSAETLARKEFVDRGLFWATATDVLDHHRTSVKRVSDKRSKGEMAELRFHPWNGGTGFLTSQVQWQTGDPVPTPERLADPNGKWRDVAQLTPWSDSPEAPRGKQKHGVLRCRVRGTKHGDHHLELPVVLHRMIPADAEIKKIIMHRDRVAGQSRITVSVVCRVPAPEPKTVGDVLDVDFGWASGGPEVGVRVAKISAAGDLPEPPVHLKPLIVSQGDWVEVWVPAEWRRVLGRPDSIREYRDKMLNVLKLQVIQQLQLAEERNQFWLLEAAATTAAEVARWRSPARFASLARRWPPDHPFAVTLEKWRADDRHHWEYEAHERDQIIARRRHFYAEVAAWLASFSRTIVVDAIDVARLRKKPDVAKGEAPQEEHSRRQIQFAAPAELRSLIEQAAHSNGVAVIHKEKVTHENLGEAEGR